MSDDEKKDSNGKDMVPLYKVEAEQVEVGMTPQFPDMSIVHIQTHNKEQDILALGFGTEAAKKLYYALGVILQLQHEFGVPDEEEDPFKSLETNGEIPKDKLN